MNSSEIHLLEGERKGQRGKGSIKRELEKKTEKEGTIDTLKTVRKEKPNSKKRLMIQKEAHTELIKNKEDT